ncbi:uncharacterized protein LOC128882819 [Hylaeus volcanicus]|uniref:uncharacterized protein LOC128882819 n=1 Tax=Hylaeus volcanicus TaxID=313075 RepID=UPI0023B7AD05|nr:uncharacterized protein LOC128882819 [Hylaeus volcanicus]
MIFLGQSPTQTNKSNKIAVTFVVGSTISLILPSLFYLNLALNNKDWDGSIECLPHLVTLANAIVKLSSLQMNRENFKSIYVSVKEEWELLQLHDEGHFLDVLTQKGSKIAQLYRIVLLSCLLIFISLPLIHPVMDIIIPLNETRRREQVLNLYYFVNGDEYFYTIYIHTAFSAIIAILTIVAADSVYMVIVHHASGLFAVCRYKVQKATENNPISESERAAESKGYQDFRQCVIAHNKAIRFFKFLDSLNRNNYLIQLGFNMVGISITAYQVIVHLDELDQAIRHCMFFTAMNFHLFVLSLPGQVLVDHSLELATNIYMSKWYQTPVRMQRVLYIMQMRCSKACSLTAGGLYDMNIENFGMIFKTCMSYFTMLLSMKE